jgi:hypothetical protein
MERSKEEGMGRQGISPSLDSGTSIIYHRPRKRVSLYRRMIANISFH